MFHNIIFLCLIRYLVQFQDGSVPHGAVLIHVIITGLSSKASFCHLKPTRQHNSCSIIIPELCNNNDVYSVDVMGMFESTCRTFHSDVYDFVIIAIISIFWGDTTFTLPQADMY